MIVTTSVTKGQIISNGLFGVLEFSQKTNKRIRSSSKNEFVRSFFGRIRKYQKSFRNFLTFRDSKSTKKTIWNHKLTWEIIWPHYDTPLQNNITFMFEWLKVESDARKIEMNSWSKCRTTDWRSLLLAR